MPHPCFVAEIATEATTEIDPGQAVFVDLETGEVTALDSHGRRVYEVAIDATGRFVVTADRDGVIRVGPITGEEPHLLFGHENSVTALAVDPEGRWIASGSEDTTVRLWPMPDLSKPPLHTLPRRELLAKLRSLTNLRVAADPESPSGWKLEIGPFLPVSAVPMTVQGKNKIVFARVYVGEVWVCSGQSNMSWPLIHTDDSEREIASARYPNLRLVRTPETRSASRWEDLAERAAWRPCSPETVSDFSAVAYYFGRELHQKLKVPVGMIHTSWGGSACEAWIKRPVLEKEIPWSPPSRAATLRSRASLVGFPTRA